MSTAKKETEKSKENVRAGTKTALIFPEDLRAAPHYMILTPIKYVRDAALTNDKLQGVLDSTRNEGNESSPTQRNAGEFGTVLSGSNRGASPKTPAFKVNFESGQLIALPLPAQLSDSLSLSYNATDMGITAAGFQAGQSIGRGEFGADEALGSGGFAFRTLAQLSDQVGSLINLMAGNVPNPYSVLTFRSVEQRTFNFDWTFSPKNEKESRTIRDIINTIRYLSLPEQNGLFLEFPHEFEIQFVGTTFLYSMSRGYITDLKVEYGSSGGNSFFALEENGQMDGAPSIIKFSFTFKEIYPLNKALINPNNPAMAPSKEFIDDSETDNNQGRADNEVPTVSPVNTSVAVEIGRFNRAVSGPPIR
jgi:hypothetical protein